MHEQHIETLREEAHRLIEVEINLLKAMKNEPALIPNEWVGDGQGINQESLDKEIEILEGEQFKLRDLNMVLAVVGTMKAGKSTSINAIVGTEVLPNRNRPMTTLPTLIRHKAGQIEPVLRFDNAAPIHRLMESLRQEIGLPSNAEIVEDLRNTDPDINDLIAMIDRGDRCRDRYEGANAIFAFLKELNDVVRLSRELGVPFPFSDYDEVDEMPVIDVEFVHLRETDRTQGKLTLLDTPGPNESGQPHLRRILKDQLRKASAVLAILDYTQLKSDADDEVRRELAEIAGTSENRLYVLINKFDQRNRHSDDEQEVKTYVAESLLDGVVRPDNVFAVSSLWAYLANRARHEIAINGQLPNFTDHPWVADFGVEALGRSWQRRIGDVEEVKDAAEGLWTGSLFHAPMDAIIRAAHAGAAALAIASAAAKLLDLAERIDNYCGTRETALTKSMAELQAHIAALQNDIAKVDDSERTARLQAERLRTEITGATRTVVATAKSEISAELDRYFEEGKRIESAALERKKREKVSESRNRRNPSSRLKDSRKDAWDKFFSPSPQRIEKETEEFDPSDPVMKFPDGRDARALVDKIQRSIAAIVSAKESGMKDAMEQAMSIFQAEFSEGIDRNCRAIVDAMQDRLSDGGFRIHLDVPNISQLSLNLSGSDMLSDAIAKKEKPVTKRRRKDNAWGTVCSWFNTDDWGWEDYHATEHYFEVDIRMIRAQVLSQVNRAFGGLDKAFVSQIDKPLARVINAFFTEFKQKVEEIRGNLLQGINDKELNQAGQQALATQLAALKKTVAAVLDDATGLKGDVGTPTSRNLEPESA